MSSSLPTLEETIEIASLAPSVAVSARVMSLLAMLQSLLSTLRSLLPRTSYLPLVEPDSTASTVHTEFPPFEVWQLERSRTAHDILMVTLMLASVVDYTVFDSAGMLTCDGDHTLGIMACFSIFLRHLASVADDKVHAQWLLSRIIGLVGLIITLYYSLDASARFERDEPFRTQAALMNLGVNALLLACVASTFAMPLWVGALVCVGAFPGDLVLIYRATKVTLPYGLNETVPGTPLFSNMHVLLSSVLSEELVGKTESAAAVILVPNSVELKYLASAILAYSVFVWLTLSNRALHAKFQETSLLSDAKERYIAALSHDFGTPIAALQMVIDSLAPDALDRQTMRGVRVSVALLGMIRKKAIQLNRLQAGQALLPELQTVNVHGLFDELESLARLLPKSADVKLSFRVLSKSGIPAFITTDRSWCVMMLVNLLTNALRHTRVGHVEVTASAIIEQDDRYLCLRVADTGEGVPAHLKPRLFSAYARASQARSSTGLGLFHLRELAVAMGGRTEYADNHPSGAIFSVIMPLFMTPPHPSIASSPGDSTGTPAEDEKAGKPVAPTAAGWRGTDDDEDLHFNWASICGGVVVDDDPTLVWLTTSLLKQLGLPEVSTATDGHGAVSLLCHYDHEKDCASLVECRCSRRPKWVVLDVQMDGMDGIEATRKVREWEKAHPAAGRVCIFGCTANGDDERTRRECFEAGMDEVIAKPLSIGFADQLFRRWYKQLKAGDSEHGSSKANGGEHADSTPSSPGASSTAQTTTERRDSSEAGSFKRSKSPRFEMEAVISDCGNETAARSMLKMWLKHSPKYVAGIQEGMSALTTRPDDAQAATRSIRKAAHSLKGSARMLHAPEATAAAEQLESLMAAADDGGGNPDPAALSEAWNVVQRAMLALTASVKDVATKDA